MRLCPEYGAILLTKETERQILSVSSIQMPVDETVGILQQGEGSMKDIRLWGVGHWIS